MRTSYPTRIICMTEETTESLYLMGEQHRIVGISGYTVRPPQARKEKPKISAFTSAKIDKILALKPDLVLGFSDMQADIAAELIRAGIEVHIFNQRSIQQIFNMILLLGSLIGCTDKAQDLIEQLSTKIVQTKHKSQQLDYHPKVYFEEWYDPYIVGINWVSELIEIAGGKDVFAKKAKNGLGKDRILADGNLVIQANPDLIIGSWCGRHFRKEMVANRKGWDSINAVKNNQLYEIKSSLILQPGPACLTDGLDALVSLIHPLAEKPKY